MKRVNNIYYKNITYQNIYNEYLKVKKSCRSDRKLYEFSKNLHTNILDIEKKLINNTYQFSNGFVFILRKPKYRIIISESISDKIVNHFIADYLLLPSLEKTLIDSNVATRKNKGASLAYKYLEKYINAIGVNDKIYALKIDMSKYFYNLDHNYLKKILKQKIKDKTALDLIFKVIDNTNNEYLNICINNIKNQEITNVNKLNISKKEKNDRINEINKLPLYHQDKGLPIGNICSQILAIYYLNEIDHYIKEDLKCRYYVRYMDDLVILDKDKEVLKRLFLLLKEKVKDVKLNINPKSNIYLINNSFTFLGYTYHIYNHKLYKKCRSVTYNKIKKKLRYLKNSNYEKYFLSIVSYKGYLGTKILNYDKEYDTIKQKYKDYIIISNFKGEIKIIDDNNIIKNKYCGIKRILKVIKDEKFIYYKANKLLINNV